MGYRIDYGQPAGKTYLPEKRGGVGLFLCGILVSLALAVTLLWPGGWNVLREYLIPGDAQVTSAAFRTAVASVRAGEPVQDVLTVFCREILWNEAAPD